MGISKLFLLSACLLVACSKEQGLDVHTCYGEYLCTADGSIIKWQTGSIKFSYEDTAPPKLRTAMGASAGHYNDYFERTNLLIDETDNSAPPYKDDYSSLNHDNVNGIYYVTGTWPWTTRIPGSLAVTLTRYDANGILEADVFIKADNTIYVGTEPTAQLPWITYISEHELGHALGRSHSKEPTSLMYPSISVRKVNTLAAEPEFLNFFSEYDLDLFDLAYK